MKTYLRRHANPDRIEVRDSKRKWLATFTQGAYSVSLTGPRRTFAEPAATNAVTHSLWVRSLPAPFDGKPNTTWLAHALQANTKKIPDALAIAMQYIAKSPALFDGDFADRGRCLLRTLIDGAREEGSDFNDYLGIPWRTRGEWTSRKSVSFAASIAQVFSAWFGATVIIAGPSLRGYRSTRAERPMLLIVQYRGDHLKSTLPHRELSRSRTNESK